METQPNKNVSLSNAFVQHPQTLFTTIETKIYHAALLCLHRNTADLTSTYTIHLKNVFSKSGSNYAAMHLAITSLLNRRWFGESLFSKLEYFKREGCIELVFNPALHEHLLHTDEYYTCLPVAELTTAGLVNPLAWRLLWLLRSYYRGYSKAKKLTISELEELVWAVKRESTGYSRLKQAVDAAVVSLQASGLVDASASTNKRGLIAKAIDFTIPAIHLCSTSTSTGNPTVVAIDVPTIIEPAGTRVAEEPQPAAPQPATLDKFSTLYNVLQQKWQLANWQVKALADYVCGDNLKYEKVRDVIRIINNDMTGIQNVGAVV